jgi:demethylmenaquinone methyltransferase/2-methoxy-6-polyprenyl-1,4-benzoquinol methylase
MYYDPNHRAERVKQLFGRIAPRYDLINSIQSLGLHKLWKRRVLKLANVASGQRALDVCCGTGDIALGLAERGAIVTGVDFSEPMLEIARRRSRGEAHLETAPELAAGRCQNSQAGTPALRGAAVPAASSRGVPAPCSLQVAPSAMSTSAHRGEKKDLPRFLAGDAQQLPFADESFDVVTCGYGLRNLEDWEKGLREMHRVARKGGKIITLDFGKPSSPIFRAVYFAYLRVMVPFFGFLFCGDSAAYAYILESLKHFPAQKGIAGSMEALGMKQVRIIELAGGAMAINHGAKKAS